MPIFLGIVEILLFDEYHIIPILIQQQHVD